jgi:beta-galactosidase
MVTQSNGTPAGNGARLLRVDARYSTIDIFSGHLKLGGRDPHGNTIDLTNYYLLRNGEPYLPVMGEFHYSRFPRRYWDEELRKIKAGGVDIVATYVFWNHVEEDEGCFDWTEDRDLRAFVQSCARHNLQAMVRLGPFNHGECRNGGLPDWLYGRSFRVRSTDERFLRYVRRLYGEISAQLGGLLFQDGGPVIGVQLDNEYMHAGAPWEVTFRQGTEWVPGGDEGEPYMRALKDIALEAGLAVPLYTCTGWVGSPVLEHELLPMQGGYAFTPWVPDPHYVQPPSGEFIFRDRHAAPLRVGTPRYTPAYYPYACCELGSGIQITYHHRPLVPAACVEAMAVVALGSGANIVGYYMYHGGSQPVGRHGYMNEFTVPRISYDFQAPIREYGQIAPSYRSLKLLHLFLHAFGHLLAPMGVVLPEGAAAIAPEDATTMRWAARVKDDSGFLFLINYQDHVRRQHYVDARFAVRLDAETVLIPREGGLVLMQDESAILPLNLMLGGVRLVYATTQPLTSLVMPDRLVYVFFAPAGMRAEYAFERAGYRECGAANAGIVEDQGRAYVTVEPGTASSITLIATTGETVQIITLTRTQAEQCWKHELWGQERLLLSDAAVLPQDGQLCLHSTGEATVELAVFPAPAEGLETASGRAAETEDGVFTRYTMRAEPVPAPLELLRNGRDWCAVRCPVDLLTRVHDIFLRIDYVGDIAEAYIDGRLVADNFYNGATWEIGLKRFADRLAQHGHELVLHVTPLRKDGSVLRYLPTGMAVRVESSDEGVAGIEAISAVVEYEIQAWRGGARELVAVQESLRSRGDTEEIT